MGEQKGTTIGRGLGFTEGPIIRKAGDYLVTSVDQGRLYRIANGEAEVFATTRGGPNAATEGTDGRIYVAQNGRGIPPYAGPRDRTMTGGVQVIAADGSSLEWVTQDPVSPNDLCFGPDGLLYVTDPTRPITRSNGRLWSVDVETGDTEILAQMDWYPNGIGFGLDPAVLLVADSTNATLVRYSIENGRLSAPDPFVKVVSEGIPDGFDFDTEGNVIVAVPRAGRIETWSMDGELLDITVVGPHDHYTNLALDEKGTLIVCDAHEGSVIEYRNWPATGLALFPFRA